MELPPQPCCENGICKDCLEINVIRQINNGYYNIKHPEVNQYLSPHEIEKIVGEDYLQLHTSIKKKIDSNVNDGGDGWLTKRCPKCGAAKSIIQSTHYETSCLNCRIEFCWYCLGLSSEAHCQNCPIKTIPGLKWVNITVFIVVTNVIEFLCYISFSFAFTLVYCVWLLGDNLFSMMANFVKKKKNRVYI